MAMQMNLWRCHVQDTVVIINLQLGGAEEKCQENGGNGMPPMPGGRGTARKSLYLADDEGGEELQTEAAGAG